MPRSDASDLGLHYLPMSILWDVRHKLVNLLDTKEYFIKPANLFTMESSLPKIIHLSKTSHFRY